VPPPSNEPLFHGRGILALISQLVEKFSQLGRCLELPNWVTPLEVVKVFNKLHSVREKTRRIPAKNKDGERRAEDFAEPRVLLRQRLHTESAWHP
jgi:hypothetical protein